MMMTGVLTHSEVSLLGSKVKPVWDDILSHWSVLVELWGEGGEVKCTWFFILSSLTCHRLSCKRKVSAKRTHTHSPPPCRETSV